MQFRSVSFFKIICSITIQKAIPAQRHSATFNSELYFVVIKFSTGKKYTFNTNKFPLMKCYWLIMLIDLIKIIKTHVVTSKIYKYLTYI